MAINDVSLTSGMRSNLLSLQNTVNLLDRTQERLSTGKKVNSAIDNAVSYFAAQSLNSRASLIDSLKDAMGQAVQTVTAADKGITAISSMIEQAKGIAQSALSAAPGTTQTVDAAGAHEFVAGTVSIDLTGMASFAAGTVSIDVSGMAEFAYANVELTLGAAVNGESLSIGGVVFTMGTDFTDLDTLAASLNEALSDQGIVVTTNGDGTTTSSITISLTSGAFAAADITDNTGGLGLTENGQVDGDSITFGGTTYTAGVDFSTANELVAVLSAGGYAASSATGDVVTAAVEGTTVTTGEFTVTAGIDVTVGTAEVAGDSITFGGTTYTAGVDFDNATELVAALSAGGYDASSATGSVVTAAIEGTTVTSGDFTATSGIDLEDVAEQAATSFTIGTTVFTAGDDFEIGATDAATANNLAAAITEAGLGNATVEGTEVTVTRNSDELNSLIAQYNTIRTQLSELAEDSGYKGKNLLSSDDLVVKFEGASLTVTGFDASAAGLGINEADWANEADINASIAELDAAASTLSSEASKLSANLSIITVRQEFSTNMINVLTEGADKLTLADTNEEGANMLMLQTRQSLSTTALSLSAQAAQSVLQLFG